jgi:(S)-2-hydroxyglutarate dehydrogenase
MTPNNTPLFSSRPAVVAVEFLVIGGGIGGLSTMRVLGEKYPKAKIVLLEKEPSLGQGTSRSDHNTGTGHTGAFYAPGTAKAIAANQGFTWLRNYHREKGLPIRNVGKIIAASMPGDDLFLKKYQQQATANGQKAAVILSGDELRATYEPLLSKKITAGLYLPEAYLFDADGVMKAMAEDISRKGGIILTNQKVLDIKALTEGWLVRTQTGEYIAQHIINSAGTHADRIAHRVGGAKTWKIMPVMGSYVELNKVVDWRTAVYEPTRNPPFLGVHVMPGINGKPFMGPDVFFSPLRERAGNETTSTHSIFKRLYEMADNIIGFPRDVRALSLRRLFPNLQFYAGMGATTDGRAEVWKHFNMHAFARDAQRLINRDLLELKGSDFSPLRSGIRAQAIDLTTGKVLQDLAKEEIANPLKPASLFISDKMPGSPGFTASVGKARWITESL